MLHHPHQLQNQLIDLNIEINDSINKYNNIPYYILIIPYHKLSQILSELSN